MSATWSVTDLSRSAPAYKKLAILLCDDLRYVKALMDCIKAEDVDNVAKALVHVSEVMGRSLLMIRTMTRAEFERNTSVTTIFRLQSLASRTIGHYVKKVGHVYLTIVLGDYLQRTIDTELATSFEIDPNKLKLSPGQVEEDVLQKNRAKLMEVAQAIFDRITSPTMLEIMPRGMRAACHFIGSVCDEITDKFTPDDKAKLIGGFIMLRFFNPALLTPESHGLLAPGIAPSPVQRRNLTLVTKLLQNLSNNVQFGQKEKFMSHMNPFLKANAKRMRAFLEQLPRDPLQRGGREAWGEISPSQLTPLVEPSNLRDFPLRDFVILHRTVVKHAATLRELVAKLPKMEGVTNPDVTFASVLSALGAEPHFSEKKSIDSGADKIGKALSVSMDSRIGCKAIRADLDTAPAFADKAFLYAGPPSAGGNAVIFLIVRRCLYEWLRYRDELVKFIRSEYEKAHEKGGPNLDLVVDLSWTSVPNDHAHSFMLDISKFVKSLPAEWGRSLQNIFVVNPNRLFFLAWHMFAKLQSPIDESKIVEMYSWKMLRTVVNELHLPEESEFFFPECFLMEVVKKKSALSNSRAKYRLLKLTTQSILVIDPATYMVKSELYLSDLAEIAHDAHTLRMTFGTDGKQIAQLSFRARSGEEVEQFVNLLLQSRIELPQHANQRKDFVVAKKNTKGHSQSRAIKVLGDCLMNAKGNNIKSFIPYLGVGRVELRGRVVVLFFEGVLDKKTKGHRELKLKDEDVAAQFHAIVQDHVLHQRQMVERYVAKLSDQISKVSFLEVVTAFRYARIWIKRIRARMPQFASNSSVGNANNNGARSAAAASQGAPASLPRGGAAPAGGQDKKRLFNFQVVAGDEDSSDESDEEGGGGGGGNSSPDEMTPKPLGQAGPEEDDDDDDDDDDDGAEEEEKKAEEKAEEEERQEGAKAEEEWAEHRDPEGRVFYFNSKTGQSSWTKPS